MSKLAFLSMGFEILINTFSTKILPIIVADKEANLAARMKMIV
jgi:hypothetical protein